MNPDLDRLHPYPFERLAALKAGLTPPALTPINLSIGEPRHAPPAFVTETLISHLHGLARYPATRGGEALRQTVARWLEHRYGLPTGSVNPDSQVLPVNGSREALFAFAQCVVDRGRNDPLVLMPNPFYQIYEGAALLAGARPWYLRTGADSGWLPDLDSVPGAVWQRCQLIYVCSPGNPSGAVLPAAAYRALLNLAERHDFVIASDECYSEIYYDEAGPPPGLLTAAHAMGNTDFSRCLVFHSLSKRSNLPGLRSGFVAGDAALVRRFLQYRTYHGCAMPLPVQAASRAAWDDEEHVRENRARYREKFDAVCAILAPVLDVRPPAGGFYLWPRTPVEDTLFARELFARQHVTVLPGSFLSREVDGHSPGRGHVRIALVAELEECCEAAERIRAFTQSL